MLFSLSDILTSSVSEIPHVRWMPLGASVSVSRPVGLAFGFPFGFLGLWPALSEFGLGGLVDVCIVFVFVLSLLVSAVVLLLVNLYLHGSCVQGGEVYTSSVLRPSLR